ncbi:LLM class F420-dependent oxidoreductase [Aquihabitans sp. G128]|uniref:LLM class F420-dependent oxidoreductase n=1 Tax=Aquihabitans sp. G128 TaxID=2849779 RepID=UPI001C224416|nr:LLM class F420-dependent oxidoreductase [Aquihabitans sp. G128]QXC59984.1 LLM class F420-dependent oxidoreductase [Aquihabitans sp. G128]
MDVGVFVPLGNGNASAEIVRAVGREVEDRGFESIWVPEHVVLFDEYESSYPYSPDGKFPGGGDTGMLEPIQALTYLAAVTDRVRLGTGICLVPQRNPVYTAKAITDLDNLSGGRVDFGVGVGWLREEFEAVAMPFEKRGQRTDEHLEVMKRLWCDETSEFHGELYDLDPCRMYPKPLQTPHPPIHVGGESDAAMRRVARHGQGWFSFNRLPEDLPEPLTRLDAALEAEGRSRSDVVLSVSPYFKQTTPEMMEQYAALGVDRLIVLCLAFSVDMLREQLDGLVTTVLEPARG